MSVPKIDAYKFGQIIIDGQTYNKDLIIIPDRVMPNWWRQEGHSLVLDDLKEAFISPPEVSILGNGAYGAQTIPDDTVKALENQGIEVLVFRTEQAC